MNDDEITKILHLIDEALAVFNRPRTTAMTVPQISVKSMLLALRAQMLIEQQRVRERVN